MLEQDISEVEVREVLEQDDVIEASVDDFDMPRQLYLGFVNQRPLHVATVDDEDAHRTEVITAYIPDPERWEPRLSHEDTLMKCGICGHGTTHAGTTTVTLDKGDATIIIRNVPAEICDNCGERFVSEEVTGRLLREAREAIKSGVEITVRSYAA